MPRDTLSRKEEREEGRRGVVGRDRGDLERARRYGSAVGVDDIVVLSLFCWYLFDASEKLMYSGNGSRSPSVESEEQEQFLGQVPIRDQEEEYEHEELAEKSGLLGGTIADRFLSRHIGRFAGRFPAKLVRVLYVIIERTILVQGFVAIMSGTAVYGGIAVCTLRNVFMYQD